MAQYTSDTNLAAANDAITVELPKDRTVSLSIQTNHDNAANASVILEFSNDGTNFLTLAAIDPTDNVTVKTSYVGADKAGTVAGPVSFKQVRARRSDANGGNCNAVLSIKPA